MEDPAAAAAAAAAARLWVFTHIVERITNAAFPPGSYPIREEYLIPSTLLSQLSSHIVAAAVISHCWVAVLSRVSEIALLEVKHVGARR